MGFDSLLGNEQLRENLNSSIRRGRFSHFYLICGPEGAGKHTLAGLLASAAVCTGEKKPCGSCSGCRKAAAGMHPDVITVDDPEKKTVSVELIRKAKADIYIRPNEAERKVYVIPRAQDMGPAAQNALLKVLEEPPAYGVFLLLTDNPEKLLPTVRSRCTELRLRALPEAQLMGILQKQYPDAQIRCGRWPCAAAAIWDRPGRFWRKAAVCRSMRCGFCVPMANGTDMRFCRCLRLWKSGSGIS